LNNEHFEGFTATSMTWFSATECLCHRWQRIKFNLSFLC